MTVAIVGILIFQIYWISNTYDVASHAFEQEVNSSLESVLNEEITNNTLNQLFGVQTLSKDTVRSGVKFGKPESLYLQESIEYIVVDSLHQGETGVHVEWNYQEYRQEGELILDSEEYPDSMLVSGERISGELRMESIPSMPGDPITIAPDDFMKVFGNVYVNVVKKEPNLDDIFAKYAKDLESRDIHIPFNLAHVKQNRIYKMTGQDPYIFNESQAIQKIPGRHYSGEVIMAFFPKTNSYLLKRMWLTILGSFFLVSLIAGSFILMLQTILKQKKVSEVKNDFINNMTHEFKTPIATVSAAMEALVSFDGLKDKERSLRYIDISRKEMTRLSGLVEKVLNISVFEQKKIILSKETFDVCKLLHEIAQQYILKGGGNVAIHYDTEVSAYIHADKLHFQNVLNNLIDNAVKYAKEQVVIEAHCQREGDYFVITVKDNGVGISKEEQKHIFEKFYRVPTGDLHSVKGFGLGLSYVKHILDMHGGTIGVKSQPGIGSEFTIAIPDIHE